MSFEPVEARMDEWIPLLVLPNLQIQGTFECLNIMALVPFTDPRIEALIKAHPYLKNSCLNFGTHSGYRYGRLFCSFIRRQQKVTRELMRLPAFAI
jgi:hypothetical protein